MNYKLFWQYLQGVKMVLGISAEGLPVAIITNQELAHAEGRPNYPSTYAPGYR